MNKLQKLQRKSKSAIDTVIGLIDGLRQTNELIETEKSANDERILALHQTQSQLDNLKTSNAKIISNFEGLLK